MKRWLIPVVAVVVIAVGVGCFFGGRATVSTTAKVPAGFPTNGSIPSGANGTRGNRAGNVVFGSIIANDGTSITVKTQDGSTKIVNFSGSTTISKSTTGSASDLTVGQEVTVSGSTDSATGTVTASTISVGRLGGFGGGRGETTTTTAKS
jgi:uncharacterized protein (UPF0333 family)